MFSEVQSTLGGLDIFVSNARPDLPGFYHRPLEITLEQWDVALNSQARAFLVAAQESARIIPKGGRIVAITYTPGGRTGSWQPWVAMGTAKAALDSLVRYFAVALAPRGITVNGISPGVFSARLTWLRVVSCAFCRKRSRTQFGPGMRAAGPRWAGWARPKISATL